MHNEFTHDCFPFPLVLEWTVPRIEGWIFFVEPSEKCRFVRPFAFGNRPCTYLDVIPYEGLFYVVHRTEDRSWIEHDPQPYRTIQQAVSRANACASASSRTGRRWMDEIDGEVLERHEHWEKPLKTERARLLNEFATLLLSGD